MALKGIGREIRRCTAFIPGTARRCRRWAVWNSDVCNNHRPLKVVDEQNKEQEKEFRRLFPKLYGRKKLKCKCSAYDIAHHPGKGHCNWPNPPTHAYVYPLIKGDVEQEVKAKLRAIGIHNKNTGYAHTFLKAKTVALLAEDLKPEDFMLLENYLYVELPDWASLPIEEKRRYIKEQMIEALKDEYPELRRKQCLKKEYPHKVATLVSVSSQEIRYKTVKEKERQRNGEIVERHYMVLESGEKIPLWFQE
ncbi:MAG: hypothetical protein ACRD5H_00725 [Nitrososphaerales archaeon]